MYKVAHKLYLSCGYIRKIKYFRFCNYTFPWDVSDPKHCFECVWINLLPPGGGVLGPKIAGGVPRATENWTQKDRGKNGILGPKRSNFERICTQKIVFVLVDEKKTPQKDRARSCQSEKRWSKPRHICITHHIGSTPPPGLLPWNSFVSCKYFVFSTRIFCICVPGFPNDCHCDVCCRVFSTRLPPVCLFTFWKSGFKPCLSVYLT